MNSAEVYFGFERDENELSFLLDSYFEQDFLSFVSGSFSICLKSLRKSIQTSRDEVAHNFRSMAGPRTGFHQVTQACSISLHAPDDHITVTTGTAPFFAAAWTVGHSADHVFPLALPSDTSK